MQAFSERLKKERKKQKLTQQELAERLHVSRTSISNWEVGRNYPDLETLILLSDVLSVSLDHLLKEDKDMVETYAQEIKSSKKKGNLVKLLSVILVSCILLLCLGYKLFVIGWRASSQEVVMEYRYTPENHFGIRVGSKKERKVELINQDGKMRVIERFELPFSKSPQKNSYYSIHSQDDEFEMVQFKNDIRHLNWNKMKQQPKDYEYKAVDFD